MPRKGNVALLGGALLVSITVGGAAVAPAALAGSDEVVYDLAPFDSSAPAVARAFRAVSGRVEPDHALVEALSDVVDAPERYDAHAIRTARWLRAALLRRLDEPERARPDEEALFGSGTSLADPLRRETALEHRKAGRPLDAALELLSLSPGSAGFAEACREAATLARDAGAPGRGAAALEGVLARPLSLDDELGLTILASDLWRAAGDEAAAARLLRELWWRTPHVAVAERLASELQAREAPLSGVEVLARVVLQATKANAAEAEAFLDRWQPRDAVETEMRSWGRDVLSRFDPKARDGAPDRVGEHLPDLAATDAEPWSLVGHALVLRKLDRDVEAAARYREVADRFPDHVLATECLNEAAGLLAVAGLPADADLLRRRAASSARPGPAQREALWRAGFAAHLAGDAEEARVFLLRLVERYGADRDGLGVTWAERGGYWLARGAERSGRVEEAVRRYTDLILRFPMGWYGLLAQGRRTALLSRPDTPTEAFRFVESGPRLASNGALPLGLDGAAADLQVVKRPALDLAVAYYRLRDEKRAVPELEALLAAGRLVGSGRSLLAELYRKAGDAEGAARVLRRQGVLAEVPTPEDVDVYAPAYPIAFREVIEREAATFGVPPALLAGLVHIESRYEEKVVSGSGAIGLTQLMPETGKRLARKVLGKRIGPNALRDPETNLALGAALLGALLQHFQGNTPLALAAYNAGRGNARKWLRTRAHLETDAFVESIPWHEARRYVMRVVSVAEVYRRLHGLEGPAVDVPEHLPLALGPFLDEELQ